MKRIFALLLTMLMVLSAVACDSETPPADSNDASATTAESVADLTTTDTESDETAEVVFTDKAVFDRDDYTLSVVAQFDCMPPNWRMGLTNKSSDKTLYFQTMEISVNGLNNNVSFFEELAPGNMGSFLLPWDSINQIIETTGSMEITDIEITLYVYDSPDVNAEPMAKEAFHLYPLGKDKATQFVRPSQPKDQVILDNEYVSVIATNCTMGFDYYVTLFVLNKTDHNIVLDFDKGAINGHKMEPDVNRGIVFAGKSVYFSLVWAGSDLDQYQINVIKKIQFDLHVYDYEDKWQSYMIDELEEGELASSTATLTP